MENIPLLSIVIPTRNREIYCIQAINYILSFDETYFELIIQDNSDTTKIFEYVNDIKDSRLKYHYIEKRLNSVVNMDLAISLAQGKFITMIGDDDTVLPSIFEVVQFAIRFNYDAVSQKNIISYNWPNSIEPGSVGELSYRLFTFDKIIPDLNEDINSFLKNGMIDYLSFDFPKVYHGIVTKDLLDKIKVKTGHYFGGLSPDIYSAMSLSFFVKKSIVIDYPFTIAGACKSSTTANNMAGGHRGELQKAPHLYLRENYIWDKRIPAFYSVETIWAESAVKSFIELNKEMMLDKFNFSYFILFSLWRGKGIRRLIIKETLNSRESILKKIILFLDVLIALIPFGVKKVMKLKKNKNIDNISIVKNIESLELAVNEIMMLMPDKFPFNA